VGSTQYYVAQSLDGYIAERDGGYDRFFAEVGAVVMGSATYEFILAEEQGRWPYEGTPCWV
jgi:dihydrofolate reductase